MTGLTPSDRHPDLITVALALLLVAATLLIQALIAAGHLAAQVLDAIAGRDQQPPGGGLGTLPLILPVVITSNEVNLASLKVLELRQLARQVGAKGWWSLNRQDCMAALLAGGAA
jgi:hypothetical protein